jgi:protein SCO1
MHPFTGLLRRARPIPPKFLLQLLLTFPLAVTAAPAAWAHQGTHAASPAGAATEGAAVSRSLVQVRLPSVRVRQHTGRVVAFDAALDDTRPVLLNFVYTTCTGICLPMSQLFAAAQERLGAGADQLQMVSVSIDPGQDTPARLAEYAGRFAAGPQWAFDTGSQEAIDAIQRAFNVYRPDKMSHTPVTFVRPRGARQWVRLDGFPSPDQLIRESQALPAVAATLP